MGDYGKSDEGSSEPMTKLGVSAAGLHLTKNEVRLSDRLSNLDESLSRLRESLHLLLDKIGPVQRPDDDDDSLPAMKEADRPAMSEVASLIDDYRSQVQSMDRLIHRNLERIEL